MTPALLAVVEDLAAAMTPLDTILAVCALVAFVLGCVGFLKLVWSISWTLRGWVETQRDHSAKLDRVVKIFGEFVETQREANGHLLENQRLQAERLDRFDAEREDVHLAVRAMNRKLNYLEGEDVKVEQRPA